MSQEIMASFAPPRATVVTNAGFQALQGRWLRFGIFAQRAGHKGPCVQAEQISFARRYSYGYNAKPCRLFLPLTDRLYPYGQVMAAYQLPGFFRRLQAWGNARPYLSGLPRCPSAWLLCGWCRS